MHTSNALLDLEDLARRLPPGEPGAAIAHAIRRTVATWQADDAIRGAYRAHDPAVRALRFGARILTLAGGLMLDAAESSVHRASLATVARDLVDTARALLDTREGATGTSTPTTARGASKRSTRKTSKRRRA